MRKNIVFGAAAVGFAGLFLAGPIAHAEDAKGQLWFSKHAVPGEPVQLAGVCSADGAMAYSNELEPHAISLGRRDSTGGFSADAKVGKNVKPGTYLVRFDCDGTKQHIQLEVEPAKQTQPKPTTSTPTAQPKPAQPSGQVAVKPKGAADTGEGDVQAAPAQQSSGLGTGAYVIGGAALLAVGGGAFTVRKLRKQG